MDGGHERPEIGLHKAWISAETINSLFEQHGVPREYDLLSVDIDYNDFWVWRAIDERSFSARIVVAEVNSHVPPGDARTVPYQADAVWDGETRYQGASVAAFAALARSKGYSLVYCESRGTRGTLSSAAFISNPFMPPTPPLSPICHSPLLSANIFRLGELFTNLPRGTTLSQSKTSVLLLVFFFTFWPPKSTMISETETHVRMPDNPFSIATCHKRRQLFLCQR
jgi:hypothetical protein